MRSLPAAMPRLLRATTTAFSHLVAVLALLDCRATARYEEEWKTATATYTKEPSGFVDTGTYVPAFSHLHSPSQQPTIKNVLL